MKEKNPNQPPRSKPLHPTVCDHRTARTVAEAGRFHPQVNSPFRGFKWQVCPTCGLMWIDVKVEDMVTGMGVHTMRIQHAVVSNDIYEDIGQHIRWMAGERREEDG